jgi:hypothetical protein
MTKYPIKILKDEHNNPFVPMVSAESIHTNDGKSFEDKLAAKLEASNLKNSSSVVVVKDGDDCSFEVNFGASDNIIDNLNTTVAGQGPLDARQGNVLKNMIPEIVDNLETVDATKVLSAKQGYELNQRVVPTGGEPGQVLKRTDDGESLEWGDAADPNAIGGDGSIMKIIELTYAEYKTLESNGELQEDTEYHITDVENGTASYMTQEQIQNMINTAVNNATAIDERHYPTLLNNWNNFQDNHNIDSANYSKACYYKDRGRVFIEGLVEITEANFIYHAPVFYLPEGYHNGKTYILTCWGCEGPVEFRISTDGAVIPWGSVASQHAWVDLGSLSFRL